MLDHLLHGCGCVGLEHSSWGSHVSPVRPHLPDCGQISGGLRFGAARPNLIVAVPAADWKSSGGRVRVSSEYLGTERRWEGVPGASCSSRVPNAAFTCNCNCHGSKSSPQFMTLNALWAINVLKIGTRNSLCKHW